MKCPGPSKLHNYMNIDNRCTKINQVVEAVLEKAYQQSQKGIGSTTKPKIENSYLQSNQVQSIIIEKNLFCNIFQ